MSDNKRNTSLRKIFLTHLHKGQVDCETSLQAISKCELNDEQDKF